MHPILCTYLSRFYLTGFSLSGKLFMFFSSGESLHHSLGCKKLVVCPILIKVAI